jgi:hypothetical protein
LRYLLDAHFSQTTAQVARADGIDAISAHEVGLSRAPDAEVLAFATGDRRVLVTQNFGDFADLSQEYIRSQREHAGILLVPTPMQPDQFARIARAIVYFDGWYPADAGPPNCVWLSDPPQPV